jgi:hypothetical protein
MTLIDLSQAGINAVNGLVSPLTTHPTTAGGACGAIVAISIVARRVSKFTRPEWPRRTTVARFIGKAAAPLGTIAIHATIGYSSVVSCITAGAYILGGLARPESHFGQIDAAMIGLSALGNAMHEVLMDAAIGGGLGSVIGIATNIWGIPTIERGGQRFAAENALVRMRKLKRFDAIRHLQIKQGCFIGLDSGKKPIYIAWPKVRETHIQIIGTTGSGKGVALGLMATQCLLAGESIVWIDPKSDRFAPRILRDAAKETDRQFHLIDLRAEMPPQINIFEGCSKSEFVDLLVAGFELQNSGTDGDFHRGRDRDAATMVAKIAIEENIKSVPDLLAACAGIKEIREQENFWRRFIELANMTPLHTRDGFGLASAIENGDAIYIVGSCEGESTKMLQRMILLRIVQIAKCRDRTRKNRHICLVLDEFKYLISPPALTALGTIRDFDVHCLLAHQSLGDLADCPGLSPASVNGAVVDNTAIKIVYRISDAIYAEKLAKLSGRRRKFNETVTKSFSTDSAITPLGTWVEGDDFAIPPEIITRLPMPSDCPGQPSVGVLFGVGNAQIFAASPIPTDPAKPLPPLATAVPMTHVAKILNGGEVI